MSARKAPKDYGPIQLATRLGLAEWQFARARADDLIPPPDTGSRWSAELADGLADRLEELVKQIGSQPDVGAFRAAEVLGQRLGFAVDANAIAELARRGLLPVVGDYKGYPLYCGRTIEAFADSEALRAAERDGELLTGDESATRMRIRRTDFDHLVRAGLLTPTSHGRGPFQSRRERPAVPLYRAADLEAVLARTDIDWAAVRSAPAGFRSPLAKLPTAP